jgi:hypothetical protein
MYHEHSIFADNWQAEIKFIDSTYVATLILLLKDVD